MPLDRHHRTIILGVLALSAAPSLAQSGLEKAEGELAKAKPGWTWSVSAEPSAWYVAPGGLVKFPRTAPGTSDKVSLSDINMDSPRASPASEINVRNQEWGFTFRGFSYSADSTAIAPESFNLGNLDVAAGDSLRVALDFSAFEVEGAYRLLRPRTLAWQRPDPGEGPTPRVRAWVDAVAGVRLYDFDLRVQDNLGGEARANETFVEALVGAKGSLELYDQVTIDAQLTIGGSPLDTRVFSVDVFPGFQWRPVPNLGVQIGYRQLLYRVSSDSDFEWSGAMAGLYFGAVLRF